MKGSQCRSLPQTRTTGSCTTTLANARPPSKVTRQGRTVSAHASETVVDDLIDKASTALSNAREALADVARINSERTNTALPAFIPSTLTFGAPLSEQTQRPESEYDSPVAAGPAVPLPVKEATAAPKAPTTSTTPPPAPPPQGDQHWGDQIGEAPTMILQRIKSRRNRRKPVDFAEPNPVQELKLPLASELESAEDAEAKAQLDMLRSVQQLTQAYLPPSRAGEEPVTAEAQAEAQAQQQATAAFDAVAEGEVAVRGESAAGHMLPDGKGVLADGSTWERESGEEFGDNGFWCRWWVLRGTALGGKVEWEEVWWESSDWSGMREMGAQKAGCNVSGNAWREAWKERVYHVAETGEPCVERSAHKWAKDEVSGEQWEEKWGEFYAATGGVNKWAEKWGKRGADVWHEKWGEDYAKGGDACLKWTDRWSETLLDGGRQRAQGDKWREEFGNGTGNKTGETWYQDENGHRYQRWWGENHYGDGWVQKYGHSTAGEHWDNTDQSGTYYNPNPHFTFQMALEHSPDLLDIPVLPREATEEQFAAGGMEGF